MRARLSILAAVIAMTVAMSSGDRTHAQSIRNASKYGAMFSWWYETLPPQTIDTPTIQWDARTTAWWNGIVRQALYARLGWIAVDAWGQDSIADPIMLDPMLRAIDANGGGLKIALFDDTTSEVLRKNQERHGLWALTPRFDLADLDG